MIPSVLCVAGKNQIAVESLRFALLAANIPTVLACPNPEDDGVDSWQPSFRKFAGNAGVPLVTVEDVQDIGDMVFCSLEYSRIIDTSMFHSQRLFNVHFSLLPAYKGVFTSAWPILNGESVSGVTLHKIDRGIDTGDIVAQRAFFLENWMTCRDLYLKYLEQGILIFRENLKKLLAQDPVLSYPQPAAGASYYSRKTIDFSQAKITWTCTADQIVRQLRAYSFKEYQLPRACGATVVDWNVTQHRSTAKPGEIVAREGARVLLATIDYDLELWLELGDESHG